MYKYLLYLIAVSLLYVNIGYTDNAEQKSIKITIQNSDIKQEVDNVENVPVNTFAWEKGNYIGGKTSELVTTLIGHTGNVYSVELVPGKIVSGSMDKTVKIWDISNGKVISTLSGHFGEVNSVCVTGDKIVSASGDRSIKVWDINSGRLLSTLNGHTDSVNSVKCIGDRIISGSSDKAIKIWDLKTGKPLNTFLGHTSAVTSVAYNNKVVVSSSYDSSVRVWDLESGKLIKTLLGHTGIVYAVSIYNDKIVSAGNDKTIKIWDLSSGRLINTLWGHNGAVYSLLTVNGKIISGSYDSMIKVWDINSGKILKTLSGHTNAVYSLGIFDGNIVSASFDKSIKIWSLTTNNPMDKVKGIVLEKLNKYFNLPAIPQPEPVPPVNLTKDDLESEISFGFRLKKANEERDNEINRLNEIYKSEVEARNKELENRMKNIDQKIAEYSGEAFRYVMGEPILENIYYDTDAGILTGLLRASDANYQYRVSMKLMPTTAKRLKDDLLGTQYSFVYSVEKGVIDLKGISLDGSKNVYAAHISERGYKPFEIKIIFNIDK